MDLREGRNIRGIIDFAGLRTGKAALNRIEVTTNAGQHLNMRLDPLADGHPSQ